MRFPKKLTASGNVLVLLSLMYFITYVDRVNISTAAPAIKSEFGLSNTELGLIFSAFAYPYALFQVFGGWLGDKWGARLTLFLCSVIWAAATILTGFAGGLASLFMIRFMLGFGEGATFPTATRAMQNWVARDRRGFAQGFVHSAARLGNAITPPMVAALIVLVTWRGSFVLLGLVSLLKRTLVEPGPHPALLRRGVCLTVALHGYSRKGWCRCRHRHCRARREPQRRAVAASQPGAAHLIEGLWARPPFAHARASPLPRLFV